MHRDRHTQTHTHTITYTRTNRLPKAIAFIEHFRIHILFLFKMKLITRNSCVHGITLKIDNSRGEVEFLYTQ